MASNSLDPCTTVYQWSESRERSPFASPAELCRRVVIDRAQLSPSSLFAAHSPSSDKHVDSVPAVHNSNDGDDQQRYRNMERSLKRNRLDNLDPIADSTAEATSIDSHVIAANRIKTLEEQVVACRIHAQSAGNAQALAQSKLESETKQFRGRETELLGQISLVRRSAILFFYWSACPILTCSLSYSYNRRSRFSWNKIVG